MAQRLRVLYVTPEAAPWAKTGGLGDVAQALPRALAIAGADVRVLVPAYSGLRTAFPEATEIAALPALGGSLPAARLLAAPGEPVLWLLDCPAYYARPGGPYQSPQGADWPDNHLRFGLLSRVAALLAGGASPLAWRPDVLHCNDWQCGLAPAYLAFAGGTRAASVMTLHNLAYQGLFPAPALADLGLPAASFTPEGLEFYGKLSFLKAGVRYADLLTTVSPSYAREIQGPELGFGLDGLLRQRSADLVGILNGIDMETWNPARDPLIAERYDAARLKDKAANKAALQRAFGLPEAPDAPLAAMASRLVPQKGADLVPGAADEIVRRGAQLVLLGTGEHELEDAWRALAARHPRHIAARIAFDERLAHMVEAGADLFLMPSRFEPCGLNQFYSMRYGTVPVVRRTGGLADSVSEQTGFLFDEPSARAFSAALGRALDAWSDRAAWRARQLVGMARDFGWRAPAAGYLEAYRRALARA
ncbi:MAG TPA: glycogen synthase GlgA [Burkholderiales bacterium]|nr:glycogen synthase GlgA [Burkholderiales bacterium]